MSKLSFVFLNNRHRIFNAMILRGSWTYYRKKLKYITTDYYMFGANYYSFLTSPQKLDNALP